MLRDMQFQGFRLLTPLLLTLYPVLASAEPIYYTSGASLETWDSDTGSRTTVATYSERLGAIAFNPAGDLFAISTVSSGVVRFSETGVWSVLATGLNQPNYLATHGDNGLVYVSRFSSGVVTRVDPSGTVTDIATLPEMVTGLACDIDGSLLATGGKRVFRIAADSTVSTVADFSTAGWPTNRFYTIGGITRANDGTFYVARQGENGLLYSLDLQGGWRFVGGHADGLISARQVAVDELGRSFVLHSWSPFAGSSQISCVTTGADIGFSGFNVQGIAVQSAVVPEPGLCLALGVCAASVSALAFGYRRKKHLAPQDSSDRGTPGASDLIEA